LAMCGYGVAMAHDYFAMTRARQRAVERTVALGIGRANICAGFELDGAFQLDRAGHVDGLIPSLSTPHAGCPAASPLEPHYWALRNFPWIQPTCFVVASAQDWLAPEPLVVETYSA